MKTSQLPYIALAMGAFLLLGVITGSKTSTDGSTMLPLFTLLAICEFAFFVSAAGVWTGIRHSLTAGLKPVYVLVTVLCGVLAVSFVYLGLGLWPQTVS